MEWAYRLFRGSKGYEDDAKQLRNLADKHEGDPFYRYGLQQTNTRYDPSAIEEDLSNDPVKAGDYGMANLRFILSNLDKWIGDEDGGKRKAELYNEILQQAMRYVRHVLQMCLASIYTKRAKSRACHAIRLCRKTSRRHRHNGCCAKRAPSPHWETTR